MHLPIAWQWFPACKDFSVSLQASCKRRNQRQPRRCHTTAKRSTRMVCRALFRPRNTAKYRGIVKGAKPRSPASKSRGVSSQASGLRKAWASRATFGSGSSCYGSVIENLRARPRNPRNPCLTPGPTFVTLRLRKRTRLQTPGQRLEGPKAISYQSYEENARHNIS